MNPLRDQRETAIPLGMSIVVVVVLEMVNINHQQSQLGIDPQTTIPLLLEALIEQSTVVETSYRIHHAHLMKLILVVFLLDMVTHLDQQQLRIKGFDDVVHRSPLQPLLDLLILTEGTEKDHRDHGSRRNLAYLFQTLMAAHARHHHVQQNQIQFIRLQPGNPLKRLHSIGGRQYLIMRLQQRKQQDLNRWFILDNQQGGVINTHDALIINRLESNGSPERPTLIVHGAQTPDQPIPPQYQLQWITPQWPKPYQKGVDPLKEGMINPPEHRFTDLPRPRL